MHYKLIILGLVLVAGLVFGLLFWDDLRINQQEIANTPMPPMTESDTNSANGMSNSDNYSEMEKDLNETDLNVDSDTAEMEAEINGL